MPVCFGEKWHVIDYESYNKYVYPLQKLQSLLNKIKIEFISPPKNKPRPSESNKEFLLASHIVIWHNITKYKQVMLHIVIYYITHITQLTPHDLASCKVIYRHATLYHI